MFCPSCGQGLAAGSDRCARCFYVLAAPAGTSSAGQATAPPVDPLLGVVLEERYKVDAFLSRGGMGAVYRGTDQRLGRSVAVKFLDERFNSDKDVVSRFHREALSAAALEHPNIIPIYGVGERQSFHYFVMKFVEGKTVTQLVQDRGRLPLREALGITLQVCEGLEHIHSRGYVHRDVKPTNVMLDARGHVYILDFGILRETTSELTQTGFVAGTPEYMSPEQARSAKGTDARSDVYSLGVMVFEMLAGRRPFKADSAFDLLLKHVSEPPPTVTSMVPDLPPVCDDIVLRALEKDPAHRFQSAAAMGDAVRIALALVESGAAWEAPRTHNAPGGGTPTGGSGPGARPRSTPQSGADARSDVHATFVRGEATPLHTDLFESSSKRRRRALMVTAVALVVGAVVATLVLTRGGNDGDGATLRATAASDAHTAPQPPPATAQVVAPLPALKAPPTTPTLPPASTTAVDAGVAIQDSTPARPSAPAKKVARATLSVRTTPPGATVTAGDEDLGTTPIENAKLSPGEHQLVVNKRGFATLKREVRLRAGSHEVLRLRLRKLEGKLSVIIRQGGKLSYAEVLLDGRAMGSAPVSERTVAAGSHRVAIRRKGYRAQEKRVDVGAGDTERVVFELVPE